MLSNCFEETLSKIVQNSKTFSGLGDYTVQDIFGKIAELEISCYVEIERPFTFKIRLDPDNLEDISKKLLETVWNKPVFGIQINYDAEMCKYRIYLKC